MIRAGTAMKRLRGTELRERPESPHLASLHSFPEILHHYAAQDEWSRD